MPNRWAHVANTYISAGTDNDSAGQKPATMSVRALKARSKGRITLLLWLNDVSVDLSDLFDNQTNEVDFFFLCHSKPQSFSIWIMQK